MPDPDQKRVLIIDDDPAFAQSLGLNLAKDGVQVRVCQFGEQGPSEARAFRPDLIILDVLMPGVHGLHVLSQLRRLPELDKTKVIVVSGLSQSEIQEQAVGRDVEFIPKAGDPKGILAGARRSLGLL